MKKGLFELKLFGFFELIFETIWNKSSPVWGVGCNCYIKSICYYYSCYIYIISKNKAKYKIILLLNMKQDVNILKGNLSQEEAISKAAIVIKKLSIQLKDKEILLIT